MTPEEKRGKGSYPAPKDKSPCRSRIALLLSTWFGVGLIPFAPGSFGSAAALPVPVLISLADLRTKLICLAVLTALAVWACNNHSIIRGSPDPPQAVMDEVVGLTIALCFVPVTFFNITAGFCLFRLFDIIKPFPIKSIERLRGGWGIVADDMAAGLYTMFTLMLLNAITS